MSKLNNIKKEASLVRKKEEELASKLAQVSPEDFLVSPAEEVDVHGDQLDRKIKEVSSYASDGPCGKCNKEHMAEDGCEQERPESMANDTSYLVDRRAQYVLHELGKIAGEMRAKDKNFAADMILSTAKNIKNNALKKAANKLRVVSGLQKMAADAYSKGDRMTGDVVTTTIQNIKKQG